MRLCELREKEVINIEDCKCLGSVLDLDFDPKSGQIQAIIVQETAKLFGLFCRDGERVIPWKHIVRIGPDIILVELPKPKPPQRPPHPKC
ncbi:MAG: YlmC/YmxH family sporulation protein [Lachnospiraceae bacterium]